VLPSPLNIPDFTQIGSESWKTNEAGVRDAIAIGCGDYGPECVELHVKTEPNPDWTVDRDCFVWKWHIPDPIYPEDVPDTPHGDNVITIWINDPCDP
jgi:hypothetical protein